MVKKPKNPENAAPVTVLKCSATRFPSLAKHLNTAQGKKIAGTFYYCPDDGRAFSTLAEMKSHILRKYGRNTKVMAAA